MSNKNQHNNIFTDEEVGNFMGLYCALKKVHDRLIEEGYEINDGKIKPPPSTS